MLFLETSDETCRAEASEEKCLVEAADDTAADEDWGGMYRDKKTKKKGYNNWNNFDQYSLGTQSQWSLICTSLQLGYMRRTFPSMQDPAGQSDFAQRYTLSEISTKAQLLDKFPIKQSMPSRFSENHGDCFQATELAKQIVRIISEVDGLLLEDQN